MAIGLRSRKEISLASRAKYQFEPEPEKPPIDKLGTMVVCALILLVLIVLGVDAPAGLISVDVGCVRLTEQFLHSDPPAPEELSAAVSVVRDHLTDVARAIPDLRDARTLVGLAGTVANLAAVEQGIAEYARERVHHFRLTRVAVEEMFRVLATETAEERRHNPGLEPARVDVIVGGTIVLAAVMRTFGFDECLTSEDDILDGIVRDLAAR